MMARLDSNYDNSIQTLSIALSINHKVTGTMSSMVPELKQKKIARDAAAAKAAAVAAVDAAQVSF